MVDQDTVERKSALAGHYNIGKFGILGADNTPGVILQDVHNLVLHQIAVWPDSIDEVGRQAATAVEADHAPGPCQSEFGSKGSLIRVEPLKWWLYGVSAPEIDPEQGVTLDISHSRTQIQVSGPDATAFLNRFLPLDLRDAFPVGSVASSVIHHVGVTLWRSEAGHQLFVPRGFALTLWEGFVDVAGQFGLEVR